MKTFQILVLLMLPFIFYSCSEKENDVYERLTPEYDVEYKSIIDKELLKYDMKSVIDAPLKDNGKIDFACYFKFFNYGGDITLFNGGGDGWFVCVGEIKYIEILDEDRDNVMFEGRYQNDKYGEWALADATIKGHSFKNVFVSPLAINAYNEGKTDCFVFVQLFSGNKYFLNAIYYCSPLDNIIISYCRDRIITCPDASLWAEGPTNGPGRFWQTIIK